METSKKSAAVILGIKSIHAELQPNGKFLIGLTAGDGGESAPPSQPQHIVNERTIIWNHTDYQTTHHAAESLEVDFAAYSDSELAKIKLTAGSNAQVRGGVVIKQTTYPPRALPKKAEKSLNILNSEVNLNTILDQLDLVFNTNSGKWDLNIKFIQPNTTKYVLSGDPFRVVTLQFGQVSERVLQLLVTKNASGPAILEIPGTLDIADLNTSLPIVITDNALVNNGQYLKKGALLIL